MSQQMPRVVRTRKELRETVAQWRREGETVSLVPTMGALHAGHISLVEQGLSRSTRSILSIFVNPTQFAPNEDLDSYPRTFEDDVEKFAKAGGHLVWAPTPGEMYPDGFATKVIPDGAATGLETDFRPHFFGGVATVCCKLFTQTLPDFAMFGEKDYQQLCVVRQMVRDLDLPLEIIGCPTIREHDGLAMSSRNAYLSTEERQTAIAMNQVLAEIAAEITVDAGNLNALCAAGAAKLIKAGFREVDYVAVRDAATFAALDRADRPVRVLAAAWLGKTRLIDNLAAGPGRH